MEVFDGPLTCFYASPCNRFSLVHLFVTACCVLLGRHCGYLAVVWLAVFLQMHFALGTNIPLFLVGFQAALGLLLGVLLRAVLNWEVCLLTEHTLHRHRSILIANLKFLFGTAVFVPANLAVPENGMAYGMWMTVIAFFLWFGLVYFSGQRRIKRSRTGVSEFVHFNRSMACVGLGFSVLLFVASLPFLGDFQASSVGVLLGPLICWYILRIRFPARRRPVSG